MGVTVTVTGRSSALDTRIPVRGSDELADLARTFNESAGELERTVRELREAEARARRFASDVSHELRTPLAGMLAVTYKADAARTRSAGSGLGLAITLENVRLHDGTIRAGNLPGGGAVFTVEIPLRAEEAGG